MASLPASRLEKICVILMRRLGTREVLITGDEIMQLEAQFPDAHLVCKYSRIADELTIFLEGIDAAVVN